MRFWSSAEGFFAESGHGRLVCGVVLGEEGEWDAVLLGHGGSEVEREALNAALDLGQLCRGGADALGEPRARHAE